MKKIKVHQLGIAAILMLCAVSCRTQKKVQQITTETLEVVNSDTVVRAYNTNINKEKIGLSDGNYTAWWSGYEMQIEMSNKQRLLVKNLLQGVRGINVKINIVVKDGYISVVSK